MPTRTTLIQRLKNWQDQSSWQEFFDTYWRLIYGVALKRGLSETEAQDVVQETMISVAKHMPTFKYDPAIGSFKAWLLKMTRWRITDQLRKRGPLADCRSFSDRTGSGTRTVDRIVDPGSHELNAVWDIEWERTLLNAATEMVKRRVDPQKYQIFDFCVNKQWAPAKVAKAFDVPVQQVYLAKHRVTEAIRAEVQRLEREMI